MHLESTCSYKIKKAQNSSEMGWKNEAKLHFFASVLSSVCPLKLPKMHETEFLPTGDVTVTSGQHP